MSVASRLFPDLRFVYRPQHYLKLRQFTNRPRSSLGLPSRPHTPSAAHPALTTDICVAVIPALPTIALIRTSCNSRFAVVANGMPDACP
jgi:hypothetical protein